MGYDLHITRRVNWFEGGNDISSEEWLEIVRNDPELKLNPANGPCFVLWNGKSTLQEPWLDWTNGQIQTKNPDDALIDKMVAIARKLGAKVQGDEGEIYKSSRDAHKTPKRGKVALSQLKFIIGGILLYFGFVELIMYLLYHRFDSNLLLPLLLAFIPWAIVLLIIFGVLLF
jgi:hypothetical protein